MHDIMIIGGGSCGTDRRSLCSKSRKSVIVIEKNSYGGR